MALALFDLDNTLINGDSDYAWGQFLVAQGVVDAEQYEARNESFYQDYVKGQLDAVAYLKFALEPLTKLETSQLQQLHAQFMQEVIQPMWLPAAVALVEKHRQQGDVPVVITSTNRFITAPIVAKLGIEHLIASEPEIIDDRYTGEIVGEPCFQAGKIICLENWLQQHEHSTEGVWFYSDSLNDLPLLEQVDNPVAVDPDESLAATAQERGWPIISLR